ncbi:MAG: ATP-binding protein [Chloroflexota bacterium]|nr:MAG: ATP-binding protein [Chloroflexota bacterium]
MTILEEEHVPIRSDIDILVARQQGRQMAATIGLTTVDQVATATAISELARNILQYARPGEIVLSLVQQDDKRGIMVVARDDGPGIPDLELVLQGGYSISGGLGLGLSGTKRLMDEFDIDSQVGRGTTVTVKKWRG